MGMLFPVMLWLLVALDGVVRNEDVTTAATTTTTTTSTTTEAVTEDSTTPTFEYSSRSTGSDYAWTTTTTSIPSMSPEEWTDMEPDESEELVSFVVEEIQKLKKEHKELDDCQKLDLSSVLSGKKQAGKTTKYSVTLKVQPMVKDEDQCQNQNATFANLHPEICEADVVEGDRGGTRSKTLLRSTCLQVEELQD